MDEKQWRKILLNQWRELMVALMKDRLLLIYRNNWRTDNIRTIHLVRSYHRGDEMRAPTGRIAEQRLPATTAENLGH